MNEDAERVNMEAEAADVLPEVPNPLPAWTVLWLAWRLLGGTGSRPAGAPESMPRWALMLAAWAHWYEQGGKGTRPPFPYPVPSRVWAVFAAAEKLKRKPSDPPTPGTPTPGLAALARNVVFCAQQADAALSAKPHYKVALSADPAYAAWATPDLVARLRAAGHPQVFSWCDCRPTGEGTPPEAGIALRDRLGLDGFIGQAESQRELDASLGVGAGIVVGNVSAWDAEEVAAGTRYVGTDRERPTAFSLATAGRLAVIAEVYTNEGDVWPDAYDGRGIPVASFCLGLYPGGKGYVPADAYRAHTPAGAWPGVGVYHAAAVEPADWQVLP